MWVNGDIFSMFPKGGNMFGDKSKDATLLP